MHWSIRNDAQWWVLITKNFNRVLKRKIKYRKSENFELKKCDNRRIEWFP